jgi:UDP-2,4-diacetamido-2,4,6-trideoxy-beta-L-altropyranose hydrolase
MRCLTLAGFLRKLGVDIHFICDDRLGVLPDKLSSGDYTLLSASDGGDVVSGGSQHERQTPHEKWLRLGLNEDANRTRALLDPWRADWLVVDHYGIDARWHSTQRDVVRKILVIDDLADRNYDCDLLLDQTYGRSHQDYRDLVPASCELLLGSNYALLRPEFSKLRGQALEKRAYTSKINRILIFMGGTDSENHTEEVLRALDRLTWIDRPEIDVVLSGKAPHLESVDLAAIQSSFNVSVHVDCDNMAELILAADLAIGAGGTASWERCALGLPTLVTAFAPNQTQVTDALEAAGAVKQWKDLAGLVEQLTQLTISPGSLKQMARIASSVTDTTGVQDLVRHMERADCA